MATMNPVELMNREMADKLLAEAAQDRNSPYAGKFIGIANGNVVAVSDDWVAADHRLRELEPDAANTFLLEIDNDGREVLAIGPLPRPCTGSAASGSRIMSAIEKLNREVADKLFEEAKQNPSAFAGKFVGIANGQVVVVTNDLDEMGRRLREAEPDAARRFFIELWRDYSEVHEIWRVA